MARFFIKSADGQNNRYRGCPTYHGTFLKPAYIEFSQIASPTLIPWEIGDYVDYTRTGYRYRLYSVPQPEKRAVATAAGDSFVYHDVQLYCASKDLEIAPFRDLVISDNQIHFTTLPSVSTYEDVYGIARRIQANMDSFYGEGEWVIRVYDTSDADLRAAMLETKEFSLSEGSCIDALAKIYDIWKMGWVYSVEDGVNTITIGRANVQDRFNTSSVFAYGVGNGIKVLKKEQSGKNDLATRLYAYGSTRNLIARYYNNITPAIKDAESVYIPNLMIPLSHWGETQLKKDARKAYLQANPSTVSRYGLRPKTIYFDGSGDYEEIYPSIEGLTAGQIRAAMQDTDEYYPSVTFHPDTQRVDEISSAENPSDNGVLSTESGGKYVQTVTLAGVRLDNTYSMAPGQDSVTISLNDICVPSTISASGKVAVTPEFTGTLSCGSTENFGSLSVRLWIEIAGKKYGERGAAITRGKNGIYLLSVDPFEITTEDIGTVALKGYIEIANSAKETGYQISVNINPGTTTLSVQITPSESFKVQVPQLGFDISKQQSSISGGLCTISFKSGWCAGRDFTVKKCQYIEASDRWELTVARQNDESIGQYFPNTVYRVVAGDRFVLTDLTMPEIYITSAMERLYARASEVLEALSTPKYVYEPDIDAKAIAKNPETLLEGMYMPLQDADVIGSEQEFVLIDSLEINEGEAAIPTYRITLQDEKRENFLAKLTRESGRNTRTISEITLRDLRNEVEELTPSVTVDEEISVRVVASHPIIGYKQSFEDEPVNTVVLTCETKGIDSPAFQWYFRGAITWVPIPNATEQAYTVDPDGDLYYLNGEIVEDFRCVVSGDPSLSGTVQIMKVLSDSLTLSLSSPAHIFMAGVQYAVEAEDRSDVIGYRGVERIPTNVDMSSVRFLDPSRVVIPATYGGGNLLDNQGRKLTDSQGQYLVTSSGNSATIYDDQHNAMMTVEVFGNNTDAAYIRVSVTEYLDIPAGVIEIPVVVREADASQSVTEKVVNLYYSWGLALQGNTSFTSVVFKRSASQPATPTGGSFDDPVPEGWSDGVPTGDDTLWMSMRVFSANGLYPQEDSWSTPTGAFDTADVDFEWSTEDPVPTKPNPGYDPSHDTTPPIWHNDSTDAVYMAIRKKSAGVWGEWEVFRCKGEKGDSPLFADLSNEADGLAVGSNGILDVQMVLQTKVSLWDGNTPVTITNITPDVPTAFEGSIVPSYPNGKADGTINFTISANTDFNSVNSVEIPIVVASAVGSRGVTFTIIPVKEGEDGAVFTLVPSVDSVKGSYNATDTLVYTPTTVSCERMMRTGSGTLSASTYGVLKYSVDGGTTRTTYSSAVSVSSAAAAGRIIFYWYNNAQEGSLIDRETIPIVVDGSAPLVADMTNEADGLAVGSDGVLTASPSTLTTAVHIYSGNTAQTITAVTENKSLIPSAFRNKFSITKSGLNTTEATVSIDITASTSSPIDFTGVDSVRIPMDVACGKGSRTVVYTIIIVKDGEDGAVFVLQPDADVVKGTRANDNSITYAPTTVSCTRKMRKGSGELSDATTIGNFYVIKNATATTPTETAYTDGTNVNVSEFASHGKVIFVWKLNGSVIDRETIPVVVDGAKGADGANGFSTATINLYKKHVGSSAPSAPTTTFTYTFNGDSLTPADSGSNPPTYDGWSREIPSGVGPTFITTAHKEANTATVQVVSADWSTPIRWTGEDGLQGKIMRGINEWVPGQGLPDGSNFEGLTDADTSHIYYDVVWYVIQGVRKYFYCNAYQKNGTLAKSITPGSDSGVWVEATDYDFIATNVLLAVNAFIDVLTGNGFYLYKGSTDGTYIVAGAQGGTGVNFFAGTEIGKSESSSSKVTKIDAAPFKVSFDGSVDASKLHITSDGTAGGSSIVISKNNVEKFKVTNEGAATAADLTITGGSISIKDSQNNEKFKVTNQGAMTASNATIVGSIEASGNNFNPTSDPQSPTRVAIKSNNGLVVYNGISYFYGGIKASGAQQQKIVAENGAKKGTVELFGSSTYGTAKLRGETATTQSEIYLYDDEATLTRGDSNAVAENIVSSPDIKHIVQMQESNYPPQGGARSDTLYILTS